MVLSTNKYKGLPCLDIITLKLSKDLKYLDVTNFRFKASSRQINSESRMQKSSFSTCEKKTIWNNLKCTKENG